MRRVWRPPKTPTAPTFTWPTPRPRTSRSNWSNATMPSFGGIAPFRANGYRKKTELGPENSPPSPNRGTAASFCHERFCPGTSRAALAHPTALFQAPRRALPGFLARARPLLHAAGPRLYQSHPEHPQRHERGPVGNRSREGGEKLFHRPGLPDPHGLGREVLSP